MDVSDIISDIDDHGFADTTTARKLQVINEAHADVCGLEEWPFLEDWVRLSFDGVSDQPTNLPVDFHAALSMERDDVSVRVEWVRFDDFESRFGSISSYVAAPTIFYFIGDEMHFWPVPSSENRVRLGYTKTVTDLDVNSVEADILIPRQYHRGILVNGALYRLYAMEDDLELSAGFERFYDKAIDRMRNFVWKKQYQTPDSIHPVDPDDMNWEL